MDEETQKSIEAHQRPAAEVGASAEAIIRHAWSELRALDPGCDCVVLWATKTLFTLAMDERVILEQDAFAAADLIDFLALVQQARRYKLDLTLNEVDGPLDLRAAREGALVRGINVRLGGRTMPVAQALDLLKACQMEASHG